MIIRIAPAAARPIRAITKAGRVTRISPDSGSHYTRNLAALLTPVTLIGCGALFILRPEKVPAENALLAIAIILLALAPTVVYLHKRNPEPLPALTIIGVFYMIAFALPVFDVARSEFPALRAELITPAPLLVVIGGILLFYLGYTCSRSQVFRHVRPLRLPTGYRDGWLTFLLWMLLIPHLVLLWVPALKTLPSLESLLEPAGYVAWGMFFLMWAKKRLHPVQGVLLAGVFFPLELVARFSSGALLPLVMFGLFGQVVYWYHARRVPWGLITIVLLVFIPLQPVKDEFRRYTWYTGRFASMNIVDKAKLFAEITWNHYTHPQPSTQPFYTSAARRVGHIRLLALVMRESPSPVPYWQGKTYESLLTKFIPRVLWPDKPKETLSHEFGHRYSLLNETDHVTAMNLPWLVELWVNFGPLGLVIGMVLFGIMFGYLVQKLDRREMTALEFVVGATILFPLCSNQESNFSIIAGNVFLLYLCLYAYFQLGYLLQPRRKKKSAMLSPLPIAPIPVRTALAIRTLELRREVER